MRAVRSSGHDLDTHPYEKSRTGKGKYEPQLTTEGFIEKRDDDDECGPTTSSADLDRSRVRARSESFVVSDHPVVLGMVQPERKEVPARPRAHRQ